MEASGAAAREIILSAASLLASRHGSTITPVDLGVRHHRRVFGYTIGYVIGRRFGSLCSPEGKRFPKHFAPVMWPWPRDLLRWGVYAFSFGLFIALLRISRPLAAR